MSNDQSLVKDDSQQPLIRSLRFSLLKNSKPNNKLWSKIRKALDNNYIVVCCLREEDLSEGLGYSVLRVEEISGNRLLELKNPWKVLELDFDWSPSSNLWTEEMKKLVALTE